MNFYTPLWVLRFHAARYWLEAGGDLDDFVRRIAHAQFLSHGLIAQGLWTGPREGAELPPIGGPGA